MNFTDYQGNAVHLSDERWMHITEHHPETEGQIGIISDTLNYPDFIQEGTKGELLAIKKFTKTPVSDNKYCVVIYKIHMVEKGFVITAYFTRRPSFRRKLLWKK